MKQWKRIFYVVVYVLWLVVRSNYAAEPVTIKNAELLVPESRQISEELEESIAVKSSNSDHEFVDLDNDNILDVVNDYEDDIVLPGSNTKFRELPHCPETTTEKTDSGLLIVSTLDGRITTLDLETGNHLWDHGVGHQKLFESSMPQMVITSEGESLRLVPALDGTLYTMNHQKVAPVSISADTLLSASFKIGEGTIFSGSKRSEVSGISSLTGDEVYRCDDRGCRRRSNSLPAAAAEDVLLFKKVVHTVFAFDPVLGVEKFNFSVGTQDAELISRHGCKAAAVKKNKPSGQHDLPSPKFNRPQGVVSARRPGDDSFVWSKKLGSPIVDAWTVQDGSMVKLDLLNPDNVPALASGDGDASALLPLSNGLSQNPSGMYIGRHNGQVYIQHSELQRNKVKAYIAADALKRVDYVFADMVPVPSIEWKPYLANSNKMKAAEEQRNLLAIEYKPDVIIDDTDGIDLNFSVNDANSDVIDPNYDGNDNIEDVSGKSVHDENLDDSNDESHFDAMSMLGADIDDFDDSDDELRMSSSTNTDTGYYLLMNEEVNMNSSSHHLPVTARPKRFPPPINAKEDISWSRKWEANKSYITAVIMIMSVFFYFSARKIIFKLLYPFRVAMRFIIRYDPAVRQEVAAAVARIDTAEHVPLLPISRENLTLPLSRENLQLPGLVHQHTLAIAQTPSTDDETKALTPLLTGLGCTARNGNSLAHSALAASTTVETVDETLQNDLHGFLMPVQGERPTLTVGYNDLSKVAKHLTMVDATGTVAKGNLPVTVTKKDSTRYEVAIDDDPDIGEPELFQICDARNEAAESPAAAAAVTAFPPTPSASLPPTPSDTDTPLTGRSRLSESGSLDSSPVVGQRFLNDFELKGILGKGGFGIVFNVSQHLSRFPFAIKIIIVPDEQEAVDKVMKEVKFFYPLYHENIVRMYGCWAEQLTRQSWKEFKNLCKTMCKAVQSNEVQPSDSVFSNSLEEEGESSEQSEDARVEESNSLFRDLNSATDTDMLPVNNRNVRRISSSLNDKITSNTTGSASIEFRDDSASVEFRDESNDSPSHRNRRLFDDITSSQNDDSIEFRDYTNSGAASQSINNENKIINDEDSTSLSGDILVKNKVYGANNGDNSESVYSNNTNTRESSSSSSQSKSKSDDMLLNDEDSGCNIVNRNNVPEASESIVFSDETNAAGENRGGIDEPKSDEPIEKVSKESGKKSKDDDRLVAIFIQMELCANFTLKSWLQEDRQRDKETVLFYFFSLVKAIEYLHDQNLMHRDLKPSNIFFSIDDDDHNKIKVGDFGLVTSAAEVAGEAALSQDEAMSPRQHTHHVGTTTYMSPELLRGERDYDYKIDIFSMGLILFELTWDMKTDQEKNKTFLLLRQTTFPPKFAQMHPQVYLLLQEMLHDDPKKRPTCRGILSKDLMQPFQSELELKNISPKEHYTLVKKQHRRTPSYTDPATLVMNSGTGAVK